MGNDVLLGGVQCRQNIVRLKMDLVAVQVFQKCQECFYKEKKVKKKCQTGKNPPNNNLFTYFMNFESKLLGTRAFTILPGSTSGTMISSVSARPP